MEYSIRSAVNRLKNGQGHSFDFFRGAIGSFSGKVLGMGVGFLVQVLLARVLGAESFGVYAWVLAWVTALLVFSVSGFDSLLVRMMPRYIAGEDWGRLRGVLKFSVLSVLTLSVVSAVAMWLIASLRQSMKGEYLDTFSVAVFVLPLFALGNLRHATFRVLREFLTAEVLEGVARPLVMALGLTILVYGLHWAPNGQIAMLSQLGASAIVFLLGTILIVRRLPAQINHATDQIDGRLWARTSVSFLAISGASALYTQGAILSLGAFGTATDTGVYAAMSRIADFAAFATAAVSAVASPMIADLYHRGDRLGLQRIVRLGNRVCFGFTLLACIFLTVFAEQVTGAYGKQFAAGKDVLLILLIGQLLMSYSALLGFVMGMTDYAKHKAAANWLAALLNGVMCIILVPRFGAIGAAVSVAVSYLIPEWVTLFFIRRRLGIWCGVY
jgi:O-antigen/teichoic acid export membrane protein